MHIDLTPCIENKFLGPALAISLALAFAPSAVGQDSGAGDYQGPGISTPGAAEVGTRGGRQVDLRIYGGVNGVFDDNLQPMETDSKGNLIRIHNLYGVEASLGAYGVHNFRHAQLGLDYHGTYRRYFDNNTFNGADQSLVLGYKYQSSRRIVLDLHESAGTLSLGNSGVAASATNDPSSALNPASVFFDSRTNYLQSTASLTWLQSARTSYTMSGSGFLQDRKQSLNLTNSWGYDLTGSVTRRVSKANSIGASYTHSHAEFPEFRLITDSNAYHGTFASNFARYWTFSLEAGVVVSEIQSPFSYTLDPFLAAVFGQKTVTGIAYIKNTYPSGVATLKRQFQRGNISFNYQRGVTAGNGFTATSRQETALAAVAYTGLRKVSLNADGGYYNLASLSQTVAKIVQYSIAGGISYNLGRATYLNLRYDYRDQEVDISGYRRKGSRAAVGLTFSPGNVPLSLW